MKTIFIGFTINKGSFVSKQTGEVVNYSQRNLRFITDSGANDIEKGFTQFTADKMKLSQLADILHISVPANNTDKDYLDKAVDSALMGLINRAVNTQFAPINNVLSLIWFAPAESK